LTSPDRLGMYYLVLSIVVIITCVQEQLVASPYIVYSKRRSGRELAEFGGSMWLHHFVVTGITIIALLATIALATATGHSSIAPGLWALVGAAPLLMLRQGVRRFNLANLHVRAAIAVDAVVALVQFGGLVLLWYFDSLSLFGIFAVMGGACGLACLGWYFLDRPQVTFVGARFLSDWRHNWVFAKWALPSYLVGNTTPQLMLWIVSLTIGSAATGIFGACASLIGMTTVLLLGVDNVLTPQAAHAFATGGVQELRRILYLAAAFLGLTLGGLCVVVFVTGDWLVVSVFGSHYVGTGAILAALSLSTLMSALGIVTSSGLWAIDQARPNFAADVVCMTVTLIAAALLIVPYGAFGAALATLAGVAISAIVRTMTLAHYLNRAAGDLRPTPAPDATHKERTLPLLTAPEAVVLNHA
jgi:O-antigen/teichoic acid export membrane protein